MSSNFTVTRVCEYCGEKFSAKTTVTKFCSRKCNSAFYKRRDRNKKIENSNKQTAAVLSSHFDLVQAKEFLTVRDLSLLLNCHKQTVYNLINSGKIRAVNILGKKTLITRKEIDKLFLPPDVIPMVPDIQSVMKVEACYTIGEVEQKFKISSKALYEILKRNQVPKLKMGKYTYVPRSIIDKLLNP